MATSSSTPLTDSLAHKLSDFACTLEYEHLGKNTVHEVKRRLIDSLGCALGAWNEEPCTIARGLATEFSAKSGASGKEIILAAAIAYEVQCRFCDQASIRARGWDHPTYGAFSTALACAKLMKLDREQTRHAINIAGVAGMGMRQSRVGELSHWKGVAFAHAARHGVYASLLASRGMTGPAPI